MQRTHTVVKAWSHWWVWCVLALLCSRDCGLGANGPGGAGGRAVRLAVLAADDSLRPAADLLVGTLSQDAALALVERAQVDKIMGELRLASTAALNPLRAGQLLGADGVLLLEKLRIGTNTTLGARLVAVQPGAVLGWQEYPWPLTDMAGWSRLAQEQFNGWFPKLAVTAKDALPLSVLNLRSAVAAPESQRIERDLTLLFTRRLGAERRLFVLERRELELLEREKFFGSENNRAFWSGAYLVDGVIDLAGLDRTNVTLNLRVISPGGNTAATVEVAGPRDQLPQLANAAVAGLLAGLHRPPAGEWNALDEAARYADEARWALRFAMDREAEAAAESAWALGLHTRTVAESQLQALHRQSTLTVPVWEYGRLSSTRTGVGVDAGKLRASLKAIELHLELTGDAGSQRWRDEAWFELCERGIVLASGILKHCHGQAALRDGFVPELARLREAVRELDKLLRGLPEAHDRAERLLVHHGTWWQDSPEAAARLLEQLVESSAYRHWTVTRLNGTPQWSAPRLVAWTAEGRWQKDAVWEGLVQKLSHSTNAATRLEASLWAVTGSVADYELEDTLPLFLRQLREYPPENWLTPAGDSMLASAETLPQIFKLQSGRENGGLSGGVPVYGTTAVAKHLIGQLFPELAQVVATNRARQAQLQAVVDHERMYAQFLARVKGDQRFAAYEFRDLVFTAREAEEVQPLWESYKKRFPAVALMYEPVETVLRNQLADTNRAASPVRLETRDTGGAAGPPPARTPTVVPATTRPSRQAAPDRFWSLPDEILRDPDHSGFRVTPLGEREGRFWLQVILADHSSSDVFHAYIVAVHPGTFASETYPVPFSNGEVRLPRGSYQIRLDQPLQGFEVQGGKMLVQTKLGLKICDLRTRQWSDAPFKVSDGMHLFSLGKRLFATSDDTILELDLAQGSARILASCRRQPPVTALDRVDHLGAPVMFKPDESRIGVHLGSTAYTYEAAWNDWVPLDIGLKKYREWDVNLQADGRLVLFGPSHGRGPEVKAAVVPGRGSAPSSTKPGGATVMPVEYGGEINQLLHDYLDQIPGPHERMASLQAGWAVADNELGVWMLMNLMKSAPLVPGQSAELGNVLLLGFDHERRHPLVVSFKITLPAEPATVLGQNAGQISPSENAVRMEAFAGGLGIFFQSAPGFWFVSAGTLKSHLNAAARSLAAWEVKRLAELEARESLWLQVFDANKNGKLDGDELRLAEKNPIYGKERQELVELRKRVGDQKGKRSTP